MSTDLIPEALHQASAISCMSFLAILSLMCEDQDWNAVRKTQVRLHGTP